MSTKNNFVFKALLIIAWLIFVGLSIEAGGLIVNFIVSVVNPGAVHKLYNKLDLSKLYQQSQWVFFGMYGFILFIAVLKAILFYNLIMLLHKLDLAKPFNDFVTQKILRISYYTFSIGIISLIARQTVKDLSKSGYALEMLQSFWVDSQAYILMAAVIYVIAQIFKRGVALQTEHDLTV